MNPGPRAPCVVRLDAVLRQAAEKHGDRAALVVPRGSGAVPEDESTSDLIVSYRRLDAGATVFAKALRADDDSQGGPVFLANFNTPEFFVAFFGALRAGRIAVPIDPQLAPRELGHLLAHSGPSTVVVDARSRANFEALDAHTTSVDEVVRLADIDVNVAPDSLSDPRAAGPLDPALMLFTSGTTGTPRAALHTHAGVLRKLNDIRAFFDLDESHRSLCILPTHFGHGLVCVCLATFHAGGSLVLCRPFDLGLMPRVWSLATEHRVTSFSSVPTIVRLLLKSAGPEVRAPDTLRFVTCASAPLHPHEVEAFEARFGVPLLNCFGSTEAGTWSTMSPRDATRPRSSVGVPVGCEVRIVDAAGAPMAPGDIGSVEVRGPSVMAGYYRDEIGTAEVLRDGWLSTGDLGSLDRAGYLYLSGRTRELIIRAGANIYPREVESVLLRHPEVEDAHVVGLDHAIHGQTVAACIVRKEGRRVSEAELLTHCRSELARYKWPERFLFVDAVPRTSRGKVRRAALEALFAAP